MLKVIPKLLRDAKAGNYLPRIHGRIRHLLQHSESNTALGLLGTNILLLDISFYQDTADFYKMLVNGIGGVIIRGGQNQWIDSKATSFMEAAKQANMPIGSYWYYDSRVSPKKQAETWKKALGDFKTPLYCWADYEETYGGQYSGWNNLYNFLEACKEIMPDRKFGIYTGYYYWLEHSPISTANLNYFAKYPLWLAWYTNNVSLVRIPKPWTSMILWQKSSSDDGYKYGVGSKEVDMNLFMGSAEDFNNFFGVDLEEPTNGEEPMTQWYKVTAEDGLRIRKGPGTSFQHIGSLAENDLVESDGKQNGWLHLISWRRGNTIMTLPDVESWCSDAYCVAVSAPVDPEPDPDPVEVLPTTLFIATKEDMSDKVKYVKEV